MMDGKSVPHAPPVTPTIQDGAKSEHFTKWVDCQKALVQLRPPITPKEQAEFLKRLGESPKSLNFAFRILCLPLTGSQKRLVQMLEIPLLNILGHGKEAVDLGAVETLEDVGNWVRKQMADTLHKEDLKRFTGNGGHLWILLHLLRCHNKKAHAMAGLKAFAQCLADSMDTGPDGSMSKIRIKPTDSARLVKCLLSGISDKLEMPQKSMDLLFGLCSAASVAETLEERLGNLEIYCKEAEKLLEHERGESERLSQERAELHSTLIGEEAAHEATRTALTKAELALERQAAIIEIAKKEVRNATMTAVTRTTGQLLENIRLFADRPIPNGNEIIAMVDQIKSSLQRMGTKEDT